MQRTLPILLLLVVALTFTEVMAQDFTWEPAVFPGDDEQDFFNSLAVTANGDILGATARGPVFRSDDVAVSWETTSISGHVLRSTAQDGLIAIDRRTIRRSTDNGNTWQNVAVNDGPDSEFSDYVQSPDGTMFTVVPGSLFWPESAGLHRSTDGGESWERVFDSLRTASVVVARDGAILCAINELVGSANGQEFDRSPEIFRSSDNGSTWLKSALFHPDVYNWHLWRAPSGAIFASANTLGDFTGSVFRSTDNGKSWHTTNLRDKAANFVETSSGHLYCSAINSGIHFSEDGGRTWQGRSSGLLDPRVIPLALHPGGTLLTCDFFGRMYRSSRPVVSDVSTTEPGGLQIAAPRPNPAGDLVLLPIRMRQAAKLRISLYAADGSLALPPREMRAAQGESTISIATSTLAAGVYYCRLQLGRTLVQKTLIIAR